MSANKSPPAKTIWAKVCGTHQQWTGLNVLLKSTLWDPAPARKRMNLRFCDA
ncbi:hypothetical protein PVAG01_02401 [Phlyctema vagabunda]|uniref:Uncharacterized protein n=1 Tax=Phlyctema vagabunda TaxID=108571 RepID=A0ABR4PQL9_9HELO